MALSWFRKKNKLRDSYDDVNRELDKLGSALRVEDRKVSNRNRSSRVFLNYIDFWENGIMWYGVQGVKNPADMALLIHLWNDKCLCSEDIEARFPDLNFPTARKKIEAGEKDYTDWCWEKLCAKKDNRFGELIELCASNSQIRSLMSYVQLRDFGLCSYIGEVNGVEYQDLPRIRITDDWEYEVRTPAMAQQEYAGRKPRQFLGRGTAKEAYRILLQHLPPDAGPARYHRGVGCCPPAA